MIKELLLSVDISNQASILSTIDYLYSIMPDDSAISAEDMAAMHKDYALMGDPHNPNQLQLELTK